MILHKTFPSPNKTLHIFNYLKVKSDVSHLHTQRKYTYFMFILHTYTFLIMYNFKSKDWTDPCYIKFSFSFQFSLKPGQKFLTCYEKT